MLAPRHPRRPSLLCGGALAALLLAACGGGSEPPPPATCDLQPSVTVGAGEAWRLIGPADWPAACSTLTVRTPALAATERLGLVLVNAGGPDNATPSIAVSGTSAFAAAGGSPVAAVASAAPNALAAGPEGLAALEAGHALVVDRRRAAMEGWLASRSASTGPAGTARALATAATCSPPAPPPDGSKRSFCKDRLTGASRIPVRREATLVKATDHALFYVADEVLAEVQALLTVRPTMWTDFADYYEGRNDGGRNAGLAKRILPALRDSFGLETDYDSSCRVVFFFANLLEYLPASSGGVIVGYFDPTDQQLADPYCSGGSTTAGSGSNGADMLFLLDPATFISKNFSLGTVLDDQLPGTMAHELQHDVIFNERCRASGELPSCGPLDDPAGDLWLNEGLAMVSEDLAGFGLDTQSERDRVGRYLNCARTSSTLCYQDVSLTTWPSGETGDPNGHYGGAHAFLRWHLDQAGGGCLPGVAGGCALTRSLVSSASPSRSAVAAASGLTFEEGFARFGAGAMFSGEDQLFASYPDSLTPAPDFAFAGGVPWSPLHTTVGRVRYTKLQPPPAAPLLASLRNDGWGAYLTGRGTGAEATVTIDSSASVKPHVAVVRFRGDLPLPSP